MKRLSRLILVSLLTVCSIHTAGAAGHSYPEIVLDDVKDVVTAPGRWKEAEWRKAGWASAAVLGTALLIDRPLRDEMRRHTGDNTFLTQAERFGAQYAAGVVGGFYVFGALTDDDTAIQVAQDGIAASLIASGIVTPAIKLVAGRSRPRADQGIYHFKPFSDVNASFPSGHTTEAFALAAVIADHYSDDWVAYSAYSVAGLVGLARTYHHAHFASDVLAGAMIGTLVGKRVVAHNRALRVNQVTVLPELAPGSVGVRASGSF